MRLGIGGGAFGIRGGISNRGFGFGIGPFSAGTSWRRRGRRASGGGGLWSFLFVAAILFLIVAWPYMVGTWIAVESGAGNPSTARFVVGWIFEVAYLAGLAAWLVKTRERRAQRAAVEGQRMAALAASGAVYSVEQGRSVVYRHGTCPVSHRSPETAASCRKSPPMPTWGMGGIAMPAGSLVAPPAATNKAALGWAGAVLVVGLIVGVLIAAGGATQTPNEGSATAKPSAVAVPTATPTKPLPAACPAMPLIGAPASAFAPVNVTMPDLTGTNGAAAEQCLRNLGLRNFDLTSVSPEHHYVVIAADWTVVSTDPPPGSVVSYPNDRVVLNVTKV